MATPAGYKPSPLGYGSPRSSPFRRPESPASPSSIKYTTPTPSPSKPSGVHTPSRFAATVESPTSSDGLTPRGYGQTNDMPFTQSLASPAHISSRTQPSLHSAAQGNALSQLQPAQLRVLRDVFQILDRDSDGVVNREDVVDMLNQLGLPSSQSDVSQFFPSAGPQTTTLAVFLNSIATTLAAMSPSTELLSAFSAFDDDDSGQVDFTELRDALLHTAPEPGERALTATEVDKIMLGFSGRRAFSKSMAGGLSKRGEVFKYQEFVNSIVGGNGSSEPSSHEASEE
ncbi:Myosin regulatory light chain 1 [Daldinia childiae]|uniref:Myosin regulatory light chain 1 n=1 Tax=Daldinia childiae TaxID=326645 RepID=UPI001447944C|nr:Myosin regulatory light chain 1 [Daldinia childiae]KAF3063719.1 Myosin regulatory light chain 1 [Daldinia childiae]